MKFKVYLSGEIHTNWRDDIIKKTKSKNLDIEFTSPTTNHELSDDIGIKILGEEDKKFWHDNKGAKINAIRTRKAILDSDIIIVKFGDKYKQWNAAFDAGFAAANNKSIIVIHSQDHQHALKEIDAAALAVVSENYQVVEILDYVLNGKLKNQ